MASLDQTLLSGRPEVDFTGNASLGSRVNGFLHVEVGKEVVLIQFYAVF